nr:hypothetical protein [uncultured Lichenicoccus sp.]
MLTADRATYQSQDLAALGELAELADAVGSIPCSAAAGRASG